MGALLGRRKRIEPKRARTLTKLDSECVEMARVIALAQHKQLADVLSDAAMPTLRRQYAEAMRALQDRIR